MLTLKKSLTKKCLSVKFFNMIGFNTINCVYVNQCNTVNSLILFGLYNEGMGLGSPCLGGM
jgi:hypothetical protein